MPTYRSRNEPQVGNDIMHVLMDYRLLLGVVIPDLVAGIGFRPAENGIAKPFCLEEVHRKLFFLLLRKLVLLDLDREDTAFLGLPFLQVDFTACEIFAFFASGAFMSRVCIACINTLDHKTFRMRFRLLFSTK